MSRAWFALAVVAIVGLFYVGFGLRGGSNMGAVAFGQEAKGGGGLAEVPPEFKPVSKLNWEVLSGSRGRAGFPPQIQRAKIPGGWLVESSRRGESGAGVGLTFVTDPEHKWDGNSLP